MYANEPSVVVGDLLGWVTPTEVIWYLVRIEPAHSIGWSTLTSGIVVVFFYRAKIWQNDWSCHEYQSWLFSSVLTINLSILNKSSSGLPVVIRSGTTGGQVEGTGSFVCGSCLLISYLSPVNLHYNYSLATKDRPCSNKLRWGDERRPPTRWNFVLEFHSGLLNFVLEFHSSHLNTEMRTLSMQWWWASIFHGYLNPRTHYQKGYLNYCTDLSMILCAT